MGILTNAHCDSDEIDEMCEKRPRVESASNDEEFEEDDWGGPDSGNEEPPPPSSSSAFWEGDEAMDEERMDQI